MISYETLALLQNAITVYDELEGKDYLLAYSSSKKQPLQFLSIKIQKKNFWHLLGCRINDESMINHDMLYEKCINGENICWHLDYTSKKSEVSTKYNVFMQIFNFIDKGRAIRLCIADQTQVFEIGAGNIKGLIGYSKDEKGEHYYPKTTQSKSIYEIDKNANYKIVFVLSKFFGEDVYKTVEYEIVNGIYEHSKPLHLDVGGDSVA
ncbi:MAG: PBECR4 domain-containing protein [Bacillota bacterium]|nr:PBECR4 domain-containing protein [Bacillota bacterium]